MPEGPSVRRWGNIARQFLKKRIKEVKGVSKVMERERWRGAFINDVVVYGKQLFFQLLKEGFSEGDTSDKELDTPRRNKTRKVHDHREKDQDYGEDSICYRYHFLMWGSLRANEYKEPSKRSKRAKRLDSPKAPNPMVEFLFEDTSFLVFYGGSIRIVDGPCKDEGTDVLSETFDVEKATAALQKPIPVCYTIMDQTYFAGAGNIVKNEVLYACRKHPLELGSNLTRDEAVQLATEVLRFTKDWLKWEEELTEYKKFGSWLKMYWKFKCPDGHKTMRGFFGDELKRMTTWCPECQKLRYESDVSKSELENIGKFRKTTHVKRIKEVAPNDDDDVKPSNKLKSKKLSGKRGARNNKSTNNILGITQEDDDDFYQVFRTSCTSKSRKSRKVSMTREKTISDTSKAEEIDDILHSFSPNKQSRKRRHSEMANSEPNEKDKHADVKHECHRGHEGVTTGTRKSLRLRAKVESQGNKSEKSVKTK
nr:endonuclease 8-like 2 [Lytechinus pictus]